MQPVCHLVENGASIINVDFESENKSAALGSIRIAAAVRVCSNHEDSIITSISRICGVEFKQVVIG